MLFFCIKAEMALSGFAEEDITSAPEVGPEITPDVLPAMLVGLLGSPESLLGEKCTLPSWMMEPSTPTDYRDIMKDIGGLFADSPSDGFLFLTEGD